MEMNRDQRETRNDGLIKYTPIVNLEQDRPYSRNFARVKGQTWQITNAHLLDHGLQRDPLQQKIKIN